MKQIYLCLSIFASFALYSCSHTMTLGYKGHDYASFNLNKRVNSEEYKVIKSVSGEAKAVYVLGLGGLSDSAITLNDSSYKDMVYNAQLKANQAIINVTSESRVAVFPFVGVRTVHTTGTVIEFTTSAESATLINNDVALISQTQKDDKSQNLLQLCIESNISKLCSVQIEKVNTTYTALGDSYINAKGDDNVKRAFLCYYLGAKQNEPDAFYLLATYYETGLRQGNFSIQQNLKLAIAFYEKAAEMSVIGAKEKAESLKK